MEDGEGKGRRKVGRWRAGRYVCDNLNGFFLIYSGTGLETTTRKKERVKLKQKEFFLEFGNVWFAQKYTTSGRRRRKDLVTSGTREARLEAERSRR
jgi:hypothetical protein